MNFGFNLGGNKRSRKPKDEVKQNITAVTEQFAIYCQLLGDNNVVSAGGRNVLYIRIIR
jgi:hypothetical protein